MNQLYSLSQPLRKAAARIALLCLTLVATSLLTQAQIVFSSGPGTGAPPATLGPYTMTKVVDATVSDESTITSLASPISGNIQFRDASNNQFPVAVYTANASWNNWSHGYTGRVYFSGFGVQTLRLNMPNNTKAFYFYAEGQAYGTFNITATTNMGGTSNAVPVTTPDGAKYFGFYVSNPADEINRIIITTQSGSNGFGIAEMGIAQCPPTTIALTASNLVLTCANPSSTISAPQGGTNYAFTGPGGFSQNGAGSTAPVTTPGTYTVVETLTGGCTATGSITLTEDKTPPQDVTFTNSGPINANNPSVSLNANSSTPNVTYSFAGPSINAQNGSGIAYTSQPGTYTVTVTNPANGCTTTATTTVGGAVSPGAICRGAQTTITVVPNGTGPFTYQWYKNGTAPANKLNEVATQQTGTQTPTLTLKSGQPGNYFVVVTDQGNGNQQTQYGPFAVSTLATCPSSPAPTRVAAVGTEPGLELRVSVLGNPLMGESLRAIVRGAQGRSLRVELLDLSGRSIRQQAWESAAGEQQVEWNLSGQGSGLYLLQAISGADAGNPAQRHSLKVVKP